VQPVPGYGDIEGTEGSTREDRNPLDILLEPAATVRGDRTWRDVTGGASVCCNHCSATIGFVSMEAPECFRLLKHRLCVPRLILGMPSSSRRLSSCASFLAREMVRYAEAKAIFTFIVTLEAPLMSFASTVYTQCILLRLVSWDCNFATSFDGEDSTEFCFQRYAKIVFEETYDKRGKHAGNWVWGGADLCCPPLNSDDESETTDGGHGKKAESLPAKQGVSSTRIQLSKEDYAETLESLRNGRKLFVKDVADATILIKMGRMPTQTDKNTDACLGLTAIPLNA
jgi:HECT-like Ubiquitin-conjugating enzyme (E2)-binding